MLELLLCSLLTILPDYLYRRYGQGKRIGQEITLLFGLVRAAVGHHRLPDAHGRADHRDLLLSPLDHQRHLVLPDRPDPARNERAGRGGLCRRQRRDQARARRSSGSTARSRRRPRRRRAARSPRSMRRWWWRGPTSLAAEGQIQEARSAYQQAVDELETKQELHRRNSGIVARREIEKLQVAVEGRQGSVDAATAAKQAAEAQISTLLPAEKASAEAALAQAAGRSGQDRGPRRRQRAGGAVRAAGRRHRQSADASGRHPDPGGRRARTPAGRLRADRGAGHEGRHGRRGDLRLEALDDHPDGGDRTCRTTSPRASSAAASS